MPGKDRRVAARQAELRRRKRQARGPGGIPSTASPVADVNPEVADTPEEVREPVAATPAPPPVSPRAARTSTWRRPNAPLRTAPQISTALVGRELRRIFILTGIILAFLIGLAILLQ